MALCHWFTWNIFQWIWRAERSFHQKKISKATLTTRLSTVREAAEGRMSDSPHGSQQEVFAEGEPKSPGVQPFERKKSIKVKMLNHLLL
jgi:hypothetical protein